MSKLLALINGSDGPDNIHAVSPFYLIDNTSDVFHNPIVTEESFERCFL